MAKIESLGEALYANRDLTKAYRFIDGLPRRPKGFVPIFHEAWRVLNRIEDETLVAALAARKDPTKPLFIRLGGEKFSLSDETVGYYLVEETSDGPMLRLIDFVDAHDIPVPESVPQLANA